METCKRDSVSALFKVIAELEVMISAAVEEKSKLIEQK